MKDTFIQLRRQYMEQVFGRMNDMQKQAVFHVQGPLLILAGAGSGKTTVLINRIANILRFGNAYESDACYGQVSDYEVEVLRECLAGDLRRYGDIAPLMEVQKARPWQILAITFTNKAAGELKDRLSAMLGEGSQDIWASTFHSTCAKILRRFGDRLGYTSHFTIYDTDDSKRLMKECVRTLKIDEKLLPIKSVLGEISRAKDKLQSPKEYIEAVGSDFRLKMVGQLYLEYQNQLKQADAMDFDDLLHKTVELFEKNQDVLEYYQNRFHYIMIDEYQDTNQAQYRFIKLLADAHQNLCVVGDDDQSIYKFRGATIENIMNFERHYPNARVIRLEQNYRSTKTILEAANEVIDHNTQRKGKTLWTQNSQGDKIIHHIAADEQDEASYIAEHILNGVEKGRKFSDHAVLYRMNAQSGTIERMFVKSGIPYRIIGGHRFYDRKEIKDVLAYLQVINNPADSIRLRRIVNEPKRGIGEQTINRAAQIADGLGISLFEVMQSADQYADLSRGAVKLKQFARMIMELVHMLDEYSIHEVYQEMLEQSGYFSMLRMQPEENADRIDNVQELASNILQYETEAGEEASLYGFLEDVALMTDLDNYDAGTDAVVMMTMHSAKGLEFPVVFVPGFEESIFPGMQSMYDPAEVEEERRLAYVTITRAKEELCCLTAEYRVLFGSTCRNKASRFLNEIPLSLIEETRTNQYVPKTTIPAAGGREGASSSAMRISVGAAPKAAPAKNTVVFQPGDMVSHKVFGAGMVLSVTPMANDCLLEIAFDKVGTKKIMANFAKVTLLS